MNDVTGDPPVFKSEACGAREMIVARAEKLFAHFGYAKTNIIDIARDCDMSAGNLYRYFKGKQAIGQAVVARFFQCCEAEMRGAIEAAPPQAEARIRAMLQTGVARLTQELERAPFIVELGDALCDDEAGCALLERHIQWKVAQLEALIRQGAQSGEFCCDDPAAMAEAALLCTKALWIPMILCRRPAQENMRQLEAVLGLILRALKPARRA